MTKTITITIADADANPHVNPSPNPEANVRSPAYFIARTTGTCWNCGVDLPLLALALPDSHETLEVADSSAVEPAVEPAADWQCAASSAFLFNIEYLPEAVGRRLSEVSPHFRRDQSGATGAAYWINHCARCGAAQGDDRLHCEPDGAFLPTNPAAAAAVELKEFNEPFEAGAAGYAYEPEYFDFMRRV